VHDYHSYGIHGTGQANGLHFHLAATINAQTGKLDIITFVLLSKLDFYRGYLNRYSAGSKFRRNSK
jgi:hypothetical protein